MRNLLDRLKFEHIEKLDQIKNVYPVTYSELCEHLSKTAFWTELKVGVAAEICGHLDITFTLSNFRNLFNEE